MSKKFYFLLLLYAISISISHAQQIAFTARADAKQVPLGSYVELTYTLKNADLQKPQMPDFKGFAVVSGPNKGNSINIINGTKTTEEYITYVLQPKRIGKFTIPPASITIKNKQYTTSPLEIEVVKDNAKAIKGNPSAFIQLTADTKNTYVGGQITLSLKLFSNIKISHSDILNAPSFDEFYVKEIATDDEMPIKEVYKGVQYQTLVLKKYVLHPQKVGSFVLSPFSMNVMAMQGFDSAMIGLESNSLPIVVNPIPTSAPKDFEGTVGHYEIEASINKSTTTINEAIALQVKVIGKGDIKRIFPPKIISPDTLQVLAPKLIEESVENEKVVKCYEYVLVPKKVGVFEVMPSLTYFDTESSTFETIKIPPIEVNVTEGKGGEVQISDNKKEHEVVLESDNYRLILYLFGVLSLFGGIFFFLKKRKTSFTATPDKSSEAQEDNLSKPISSDIAVLPDKNNMYLAKKAMQEGNEDVFYKEIIIVIETALRQKYDKQYVSNAAVLASISPLLAQNIKLLLSKCEEARYGGKINHYDMTEIFNEAENLILLINK